MRSNNIPRRIVVVGGVAAGPAAAAEAKRVDPAAEVLLFEQGPHISYGACEIPYYAAKWIDDLDRLIMLTPEEFEKTRGARAKVHHRVTRIDAAQRKLTVEALKFGSVHEYAYDQLILAVGAAPRRLEIPGGDAPNVFTVRSLQDARGIRAHLDSGEVSHVVVVGGSYIGLEMAEAVRARGLRATILEMTGKLVPTLIDDELRGIVHERVASRGVTIRAEKPVRFERRSDGFVTAVWTDRGEKIGCQLVLVAVGLTPRTGLAESAGIRIDKKGTIGVDSTMKTSVRNIWACGDCIAVERVIDRRPIYLPLSPIAFRTARVAARNAGRRGAGAVAHFPGVAGAAAVQVFGLEIAGTGLRLSDALASGFDAFSVSMKGWSRVAMYPGAKRLHVRYVAERGSGRLLGAELVGDEGAGLRLNVLTQAIHDGATVFDIGEYEMLYTPPIAPARDPLLIAASIAAREARKKAGRPLPRAERPSG